MSDNLGNNTIKNEQNTNNELVLEFEDAEKFYEIFTRIVNDPTIFKAESDSEECIWLDDSEQNFPGK